MTGCNDTAAGYAEHCAKSSVRCQGPPPDAALSPGLAATHVAVDGGSSSSSSSLFERCYPPRSYARLLINQLGLKSCGEFRGADADNNNAISQTKLAEVSAHLETARGVMTACSAKLRSRDAASGEQCDLRETGFNPGAFNAGFGPDAPKVRGKGGGRRRTCSGRYSYERASFQFQIQFQFQLTHTFTS